MVMGFPMEDKLYFEMLRKQGYDYDPKDPMKSWLM
jgi:hypothetical protein